MTRITTDLQLPVNADRTFVYSLQGILRNLSRGVDEAGLKLIYPFTTPTTPDETLLDNCLAITAGITIPANVFRKGAIWSAYNNSAGALTLTQGTGLTLRLHGTATTGNRTIPQRGFCTFWSFSLTEIITLGDVT